MCLPFLLLRHLWCACPVVLTKGLRKPHWACAACHVLYKEAHGMRQEGMLSSLARWWPQHLLTEITASLCPIVEAAMTDWAGYSFWATSHQHGDWGLWMVVPDGDGDESPHGKKKTLSLWGTTARATWPSDLIYTWRLVLFVVWLR